LKGFSGALRDVLGTWFLKRKGGLIRKSGRSVVRGLGIPATDRMLKSSGLWTWELWYVNSVPSRYPEIGKEEEGVALPISPSFLTGQVVLPKGWSLLPPPKNKALHKKALDDERGFWDEVTESAWTSGFNPKKATDQFWSDVAAGGFESGWVQWRDLHKAARLRPIVKKLLGSCYRSRLPSKGLYRVINQDKRKREKRVWQRVDEDIVEDPREVMIEVVRTALRLSVTRDLGLGSSGAEEPAELDGRPRLDFPPPPFWKELETFVRPIDT